MQTGVVKTGMLAREKGLKRIEAESGYDCLWSARRWPSLVAGRTPNMVQSASVPAVKETLRNAWKSKPTTAEKALSSVVLPGVRVILDVSIFVA